jgi:hypothetical protein
MRNPRSRRSLQAGAALLLAVVVTAGCGGGDDKTTTAAGGTATTTAGSPSTAVTSPAVTSSPAATVGEGACKYVSTAQAAALVTSPVKPGVPSSVTQQSVTFDYCTYTLDPGNAPGVLIAVAHIPGDGAAGFAAFKQDQAQKSDFQDVAGVGDEAYFAGENLYVRQGNTGLILFVSQGNRNNGYPRGTDGIPDEKALAAIILPQL